MRDGLVGIVGHRQMVAHMVVLAFLQRNSKLCFLLFLFLFLNL